MVSFFFFFFLTFVPKKIDSQLKLNLAYYAAKNLRPNGAIITTDVCVPISKLAQVIVETKNDIQTTSLQARMILQLFILQFLFYLNLI